MMLFSQPSSHFFLLAILNALIQLVRNHVLHAVFRDIATRRKSRSLLLFLSWLTVDLECHEKARHGLFLDRFKLLVIKLIFLIFVIILVDNLLNGFLVCCVLLLLFKRAKVHETIVIFSTLDQFETAAQIVSKTIPLIDLMDLSHVLFLSKTQMIFHVVQSIGRHL